MLSTFWNVANAWAFDSFLFIHLNLQIIFVTNWLMFWLLLGFELMDKIYVGQSTWKELFATTNFFQKYKYSITLHVIFVYKNLSLSHRAHSNSLKFWTYLFAREGVSSEGYVEVWLSWAKVSTLICPAYMHPFGFYFLFCPTWLLFALFNIYFFSI